MDINRNPGGYFWPYEHLQPRAKPWLFLGYRSAVLRKNSPAFSIALCHLRRHLYYEHSYLPASLLLTPERGSPSHRQFLKTNSFHEVLRLRNSFLRNSTFDVRYSIFLQSCEPMDINRNPWRLFLALRTPPTTGKTVAIFGLPLCGTANRPALHFLSLSATYWCKMFLYHSFFLAFSHPLTSSGFYRTILHLCVLN